jgi:hypothetical protein
MSIQSEAAKDAMEMRRIRHCVVMSLDGYIAGPNGAADWIALSYPEEGAVQTTLKTFAFPLEKSSAGAPENHK